MRVVSHRKRRTAEPVIREGDDGRYSWASAACRGSPRLGRARSWSGRPAVDFVHPDDRLRATEGAYRHLPQGRRLRLGRGPLAARRGAAGPSGCWCRVDARRRRRGAEGLRGALRAGVQRRADRDGARQPGRHLAAGEPGALPHRRLRRGRAPRRPDPGHHAPRRPRQGPRPDGRDGPWRARPLRHGEALRARRRRARVGAAVGVDRGRRRWRAGLLHLPGPGRHRAPPPGAPAAATPRASTPPCTASRRRSRTASARRPCGRWSPARPRACSPSRRRSWPASWGARRWSSARTAGSSRSGRACPPPGRACWPRSRAPTRAPASTPTSDLGRRLAPARPGHGARADGQRRRARDGRRRAVGRPAGLDGRRRRLRAATRPTGWRASPSSWRSASPTPRRARSCSAGR